MGEKKVKNILKYHLLDEKHKIMEFEKIMDKISKNKSITKKEKIFLKLFTGNKVKKDYLYLSKNFTFYKIIELLEEGLVIICNLKDRNGKIGLKILKIENNFEEDTCKVMMKGEEIHNLEDKYLYNLIYNVENNEYSLEEQDEYFEKIEFGND